MLRRVLSTSGLLRTGLRTRSTAAETNAAGVNDVTSASALNAAKPYDEIPGPKVSASRVANIKGFITALRTLPKLNIHELQEFLHKQYGDIVRLTGAFGRNDQVILYNPETVEKVFRSDGRWPHRVGGGTLHYYRTVLRKDRFKGQAGTITTQGEDWHKFRTKVNQPLMRSRSAVPYVPCINEVADEFLDKMQILLDHNNELPEDFIKEIHKWSVESIASVALDTRLGCLAVDLPPGSDAQRLVQATHTVFECLLKLEFIPSIWKYVSTPAWRRFVAALDTFTDIADKYVNKAAERLKQHSSDLEQSILERILVTEGPEVANLMVTDLLFGGVDTTSNLMSSLLFHIATNPRPQEKLAEELKRALPNPRALVTAEALEKMPYLKACIKESLRVFPVVYGNGRRLQNDMILEGYRVPKGVDVFFAHMVMSRDEKHFPRPLSFEPERWLRGSAETHTAHPFTTMPFGFGPRMCVGRRFAELEVQTLLAKIVRNFKMEYHYGDKIVYTSNIMNIITSPLKFRLLPRET